MLTYGLREGSYKAIGDNLGIDPYTACRIVNLYSRTDNVNKKNYTKVHDNMPRKFTDNIKIFITQISGIHEVHNTVLAISTFLHSEGLSRQRMHVTAMQRDKALHTHLY